MHSSAFADAKAFFIDYIYTQSIAAESINVLDVGSKNVNGTLTSLMPHAWEYHGIDIEAGDNVTHVVPKSFPWPFPDGHFGCAVCTQVYEHLRKPGQMSREVFRLLRPGSLYYVCAPNSLAYHPYPIDCFRYFADGLASVVDDGGFEILAAYHSETGPDGVGDTTVIARKPADSIS